jgi:hypothetical protein
MLAMLKVDDDEGELPSIRHDEDHDWWIVRDRLQVGSGEAAKPQVLDFVLVGIVEE